MKGLVVLVLAPLVLCGCQSSQKSKAELQALCADRRIDARAVITLTSARQPIRHPPNSCSNGQNYSRRNNPNGKAVRFAAEQPGNRDR
jgi:hypothetical protein